MQPDSGERSVLVQFPAMEDARSAAGELRGAGYHTVEVGRISHYGNSDDWHTPPLAGAGETAGMTIFSQEMDSAGMTGGAQGDESTEEGSGGASFLVTVVGGEGSAGQVREIVKKYGGIV